MKAITNRMLLSLAGIALVAPFFAVALIISARAVALSQGTQDDLLMIALALGGELPAPLTISVVARLKQKIVSRCQPKRVSQRKRETFP